MRISDELSLQLQPGDDAAPPRSLLCRHGRSTGREIDAALLEAAIEISNGFLLFTIDDVPFEEFLGVHLLDRDLKLIDQARIGAAYTTGTFSDLVLVPPDRVRFRFIGNTDWSVVLLGGPVLRTPFNAEPAGVHRRIGMRRHFTVEESPRPNSRQG